MNWMTSRYQDKPRICAICGGAIDAGYPRMYSPGTGVSAHVNCVPKTPPTAQPTAIPPPGGDKPMSGAEKGHQENMESAEMTRLVLDRLVKAIEAEVVALNERNRLLQGMKP